MLNTAWRASTAGGKALGQRIQMNSVQLPAALLLPVLSRLLMFRRKVSAFQGPSWDVVLRRWLRRLTLCCAQYFFALARVGCDS